MLWGNAIGLAFYFLQKWFGIFKLDPETYYMDTVPVSFSILLFLLLNIGTLLASVLMLLGPSFLITRIHPANSMRITNRNAAFHRPKCHTSTSEMPHFVGDKCGSCSIELCI